LKVPVVPGANVLSVEAWDLRGNRLTNLTSVITVNFTGDGVDPEGWIVFNEIMYHPAAPEASFVELHNRSDVVSFDLAGWRINGLSYTFPPGSFILPGRHLVLAKNPAAYMTAYGLAVPPPFGAYDGVLQNDGETLTLLRPGANPGEEIEVDKVKYEGVQPWPQAPNGTGSSLELVDSSRDNSRVGNWSGGAQWRFFSFTAVPGSANSILFSLGSPGVVYLDDVALVSGPVAGEGPNLITNGDLETGALAPWSGLRNHAGTEVTSEVAYQGNYSLKIVAEGVGSTVDL
jgi:hypothetical protein